MNSSRIGLMLVVACLGVTQYSAVFATPKLEVVITDIWDRRLNEYGITLVDWQGFMANPAIQFQLTPPPNAVFPAIATLTADNNRLYFDLAPVCFARQMIDPCRASMVGADGPTRTVIFKDKTPQIVNLSIFPDRDTKDETHKLTIRFRDNRGTVITQNMPVHVIDQDVDLPPTFNITLDFSKDTSGFFSNPTYGKQRQAIAQQAADDWAYFIDGTGLDPYTANPIEQGVLMDPTTKQYICVDNTKPYKDLLVYLVGVRASQPPFNPYSYVALPSICPRAGVLRRDGSSLFIDRSGGINIELRGNYNWLGYFLTKSEDDWWRTGNLSDQPADFYSIIHHELGHVLAFGYGNGVYYSGCQYGLGVDLILIDPDLTFYYGAIPFFDTGCHFTGVVDPESRKGALGNEYGGLMPNRRWLITKFDLLALKAAGYALRQNSAFIPLSLAQSNLPGGNIGEYYQTGLKAQGGIPFYNWAIETGALPVGLKLDRFTGLISGTPYSIGAFDFTVRVRDYDAKAKGVSQDFEIVVK